MTPIEIDALVYKVIRANQDKPKKVIWQYVKEVVPKEHHSDLVPSLERLIQRCS